MGIAVSAMAASGCSLDGDATLEISEFVSGSGITEILFVSNK